MGFTKEILHKSGFYTKTEYEELKKNNQNLWDALNSAHACLSSYGFTLDQELNCDNPEKWISSMRLEVQKILEEGDKVRKVLHECDR